MAKLAKDTSYNLLDEVCIEGREIFLHPSVEIDHDVAGRFVRRVRALESMSDSPIIFHLCSGGGSWHDGMAIYDCIKHSSCSFIVLCYGIAASMGSLIPQAAWPKGKRISMPNCDWMIHEGYLELSGSHRQVISSATWDNKSKNFMYNVYTDVCESTGGYFEGKTRNQIKSYLKRKLDSKEDWWMSSDDALLYGFVDNIIGNEDVENVDKIVKNVSRVLQL